MTIGAIISIVVGIIILIGGIILGMWSIFADSKRAGACIIVVCVILAALFIVLPFVYMTTETGKRALKDQQSNFGDGIDRVVRVYDINGKIIEQYDGKFDIETNNNDYILFDDENGKRHIIYYTTGTVIVDEK